MRTVSKFRYSFSRMLTRKYAIEISGFDFMNYGDGGEKKPLVFCDFWLSYDERKRDHSPAIQFYLEISGFVLVDFSLHNVNHALEEIK